MSAISSPAPLRWRQIVLITVGAVVLYAGFRALPTGTNLHSGDFSVPGKGMVELCDPANPQFVAVTTARSPVTLTLRTDSTTVTAGRETQLTLSLVTSTGKPVGPADLLVQHTRKLHLLVIDPTLHDYQHLHPEPGAIDGEWTVAFTPRLAGIYRVFADFVPVPTGRSLYAGAELAVAGVGAGIDTVAVNSPASPPPHSWIAEVAGYRFTLTPEAPIRAGQVANLSFEISRLGGGPVPMELVMDAYAHLVAFDQGLSGFAHLHPMTPTPTTPAESPTPASPVSAPDTTHPRLAFRITIPAAGEYVIWAQVKLAGREVFAPFRFAVAP